MDGYPRYNPFRTFCRQCKYNRAESKYVSGREVREFIGWSRLRAFFSFGLPCQAMGRICVWCGFRWIERLGGGAP